MEDTRFRVPKMGHGKKDFLHSLCKNKKLYHEESSTSQLKKEVKRAKSHQAKVVNKLKIGKVFLKDLFFLLVHRHNTKQMVSADKMFLRHCLEFEHSTALRASQYSIPVSLRDKNMGTSTESLNTAKFTGGDECASGQLVPKYRVASMTESVDKRTIADKQWTLGTVMGIKSLIKIMNSPLLKRFHAAYRNDNLNRMNLNDAKDMICYDFMDSSCGFGISSSCEPEKETPMAQSHKDGSISVHERVASTSRTSSTSDSLSFASSTLSQGMLHCTWKQGIPQFVFSSDDQNEVYVATLSKVGLKDDKALEYVYLFHLDKGDQKGHEIPDSDLQLVGNMNVSTIFTICPNNYRIMETQFILFGNIRIYDKEIHTSSHSHRKNKGLSKVFKVFRTIPSSIHKTLSKFSASSSIVESCPGEAQQCDLGGTNLLETTVPPNFELAAIVVKDHLPFNKLDKVAGWGLKLLDKSAVNQTTLPSESCSENTVDCTIGMSILIPAGFHGGPRTTSGSSSSLIDRWRSGGSCDCGGWDEGCPLTVLQRRSSTVEVLSQVDVQDEFESIDLVPQGSNNLSPTLRIENIHDGLHIIHFQPSLSALQSFSIAVALIHAQTPTLRTQL